MKKAVKTTVILVTFFAVIPALASLAITALWNAVLVSACGFAAIGFWEGAGLFLLGQFLTGGFIIGLLILLGSLHRVFHHHGDWAAHWHGMTDSERREFIERRRREHHMFHHSAIDREDAAQ